MQSIRLKINDKIFEKVLWLLSKFDKDEVEIIFEESGDKSVFTNNQKYLKKELEEVLDGSAKFLSEEEAEYRLAKIIKKYEDRL